ncbi:MAG: TolC family protein, partial [Thiobacillus sp.]
MRFSFLRPGPRCGVAFRAAAASSLFWFLLSPAAFADPAALTLEGAWRRAEEANPALRAAQAAVPAAEGELRDARAPLWNNPQVSMERRRKEVPQVSNPTQTNREWGVGLAQTFEIAGQQGARRTSAEQSLAATRQAIAETRRQVRAEVESRFARVLSLQLRIQTEETTLNLIEDAANAVGKRVAAGEDSRLDGNLARVDAERARNQVALLREQLIQARAELAALLQLPPNELPQAQGALDP